MSLYCWSNCRGQLLEATRNRDSVNDAVKKVVPNLCWWLPPLLTMQQYRWELKHDSSVQRSTRVNGNIAFMSTPARWFGVNGSLFILVHETMHKRVWRNSKPWPPDCKRRFKLSVFFGGAVSYYKMAAPLHEARTCTCSEQDSALCDRLMVFDSCGMVLPAKKTDV